MSMKFFIIALMVMGAIPAAMKLYNHFKWNEPWGEVFVVLYYGEFGAFMVFCLMLTVLPWRASYSYNSGGELRYMNWCFYEEKEKIQEARTYPIILRNDSDRALELVWIGYGEVTSRRDTLLPGETIRYGRRVKRVQPISRELNYIENSLSSPAYVILAMEEGTVPADSLDRLQRKERTWEYSLDYENYNYN